MKTKNKSTLIASVLLASTALVFALPLGGTVAGATVTAALLGLGYLEAKQGAYRPLPGRAR